MKMDFTKKIEQFLDKELLPAEKTEFISAIATDKQLEIAVKEEIILREAIQAHSQEAVMRANIKKWRQEAKNTPKPLYLYYRLAAAATIALLVGIATFLYMPSQYTNKAILASHYKMDQSLLSNLKKGDNNADTLEEAMEAYQQQDYSRAIKSLQKYPNNDKAIYTLGHSYLVTHAYEKAIEQFSKILLRKNPQYQAKAKWYLLLSYLGNDQIDAAFRTLLEEIIEEKGDYSSKAQQIKTEINSFWRKL